MEERKMEIEQAEQMVKGVLLMVHQQKNHLAPHLSPLTLCARRSRR